MSQGSSSPSNPAGSNPSGVDLLGQSGSDSAERDPKDEQIRTIETAQNLADAIRSRQEGR